MSLRKQFEQLAELLSFGRGKQVSSTVKSHCVEICSAVLTLPFAPLPSCQGLMTPKKSSHAGGRRVGSVSFVSIG